MIGNNKMILNNGTMQEEIEIVDGNLSLNVVKQK